MIANNGQNPQTDGFITEDNEPYVMKNMRVKKKMSVVIKILIAFGVLTGIAILILGLVILKKVKEREKYKDPVFIQQDVTNYLEERYGEKFVVTFNRGTGSAYNYVQLFAYPEGYDDEKHKIEIQGYYNKKGELEYYDSYVMVKLTDEYEAYIDPIIGEYFDEYKFYMKFDSEWLTNNLPADTKLEDLWELKANQDYSMPELFLYLKNTQKEKYNDITICSLSEVLQEKGFRGMFRIRIYFNDKFYNKRNRDNVYENIGAKKDEVKGNTIFIYDNDIEY